VYNNSLKASCNFTDNKKPYGLLVKLQCSERIKKSNDILKSNTSAIQFADNSGNSVSYYILSIGISKENISLHFLKNSLHL